MEARSNYYDKSMHMDAITSWELTLAWLSIMVVGMSVQSSESLAVHNRNMIVKSVSYL